MFLVKSIIVRSPFIACESGQTLTNHKQVPITGLATMAWCIKEASGGGKLLQAGPTVHGEAFASAWLLSMTSLIGGYATVALSTGSRSKGCTLSLTHLADIPDFTRYAKSPMSQYIQAPVLPALCTCSPETERSETDWLDR